MELMAKQGFKQTEVGLIPEDWTCKAISEVCFLKHGFQFLEEHFTKSGVGVVKIGNLDDGKGIKEQNLTFVSNELANRLSNFYLSKGDVLMALTGGTLGKVSVVNTGKPLLQNYRVGNFLPNAELAKSYLHQILTSFYLKNAVKKLVNEAAQPNFGKQDFDKLYVPLPPTLTEQKAIATALSDVDELISSLEQLITKKKAIKQGAMQELLTPPHKGGKRLPGFEGEWKEKNLGKIGNTFGGLSGKSKRDFEDGVYPYITFLNVMNNTIIDTSIFAYVNIKPGENQNKARKGDLFFNTSSETPEEVGMCAVLNEDVENLYLNSFCFGYRLKEEFEVEALFFSYLINSSIGRKLFLSLAQGATRYNLSKSNFNKLIICIPESKKEQKAIAQILFDMDSEIDHLDGKKEKYQSIKQGMMQELLTGRTRLV